MTLDMPRPQALPMVDRFGVLHWTATSLAALGRPGHGLPPLVPDDATYCELVTLDLTPVDLRHLLVERTEPLRVVGEGIRGMCPECYPASVPEQNRPRP